MPQRIQRRREKGWRTPLCSCGCGESARYVGRPSRWGNPFTVAKPCLVERYYPTFTRVTVTPRDRREAAAWLGLTLGRDWALPNSVLDIAIIRRELRGHDLACWCPLPDPGQPDHCHAAVLLELANG